MNAKKEFKKAYGFARANLKTMAAGFRETPYEMLDGADLIDIAKSLSKHSGLYDCNQKALEKATTILMKAIRCSQYVPATIQERLEELRNPIPFD